MHWGWEKKKKIATHYIFHIQFVQVSDAFFYNNVSKNATEEVKPQHGELESRDDADAASTSLS